MPSIDTAVFQLSALALLGLILLVAVIALLRLGGLKRSLAERPRTTAADVVPFAEQEARPEETREEPPAKEGPREAREPDQEEPPPAQEAPAAAATEEPALAETEGGQPSAAAAEAARDEEGPAEQAPSPRAEEREEEPAEVAEPSPAPEPELVREAPPAEEAGPGELEPEPAAAAPREEGASELQPEPVAAGEGVEPAAAAAGAYWPTEESRPEEGLESEPVSVGEDEPGEKVDATGGAGASTAQQPAVRGAESPAEVVGTPSTVSAQQQQVAEGQSEFAAERTWDDLSQETEAPGNGDSSTSEPEGVLGAAWAYDWAREMPEEQPIEREGRWWFKRGGELLLYDETTAQWVPAPMPEARSGDEPAGNSNGVEFGGAAAPLQSSFWKCPSCGAVNGSTASTCRMCFAARP